MAEAVKAAIYARYSSHAQGEQSIEGQLSEGRKYAEKQGYTVVKEYIDRAVSGRTDNRTAFQQMLADLPKKAYTVLILWKVDRFGRNREEIAINKQRCRKYGVHPEYIAETIPDSPEGVILESVLEGIAEYYSLQLSQNVKRGRRASAEKCQSVGAPPPFGYKVGEDKRYIPDPDTAPIARSIFDGYLQGRSMAEIATGLSDAGTRTRKGKPWTVENIRKILSNERYTGTYIVGDIRVEGGMPQIVTHEEWSRVQDVMAKNKKSPNHRWSRADFLLTGKIFCGGCGSVVTGASGYGKNGVKHAYYACQGHRKKHTCPVMPKPREAVEGAVLAVINDLLDNDELLEWIADQVVAILDESNGAMDKTGLIKKQISEVDKGITNLMNVLESGVVSDAILKRLSDLETEKAQLERDLVEEEAAQALRLTRDHVLYFLYKLKNGRTDSRESQQKLIDVFVKRVYLIGDDLEIHLNHSGDGATIVRSLAHGSSGSASEGVRLSRPLVHQSTTGRTPSTIILTSIDGAPVLLVQTKTADRG